jgi:hypothetical protein
MADQLIEQPPKLLLSSKLPSSSPGPPTVETNADSSDTEQTSTEVLLSKLSSCRPDSMISEVLTGGNSDLTYFTKNTFSKECAFLGLNFYRRLNILEVFRYTKSDPRVSVISVLYLFYKYQLHHSDMALNLATALIYLEDNQSSDSTPLTNKTSISCPTFPPEQSFNLVLYSAYLAHAWNDDVTIRLKDWYHDVGRIYFQSMCDMNSYVWKLMVDFNFKLNADPKRVKRHIRVLCQAVKE